MCSASSHRAYLCCLLGALCISQAKGFEAQGPSQRRAVFRPDRCFLSMLPSLWGVRHLCVIRHLPVWEKGSGRGEKSWGKESSILGCCVARSGVALWLASFLNPLDSSGGTSRPVAASMMCIRAVGMQSVLRFLQAKQLDVFFPFQILNVCFCPRSSKNHTRSCSHMPSKFPTTCECPTGSWSAITSLMLTRRAGPGMDGAPHAASSVAQSAFHETQRDSIRRVTLSRPGVCWL